MTPAKPVVQKVLDEQLITSMLGNQTILREFPFLATQAQRKTQQTSRCGGCSRKQSHRAVDYTIIKQSIMQLPEHRLNRLKELLGTEQLRLSYRGRNGKVDKKVL